tara:strand:+ start:39 stop:365 length:327 start_codon:yes stop_codon:yes gene_type:complete
MITYIIDHKYQNLFNNNTNLIIPYNTSNIIYNITFDINNNIITKQNNSPNPIVWTYIKKLAKKIEKICEPQGIHYTIIIHIIDDIYTLIEDVFNNKHIENVILKKVNC